MLASLGYQGYEFSRALKSSVQDETQISAQSIPHVSTQKSNVNFNQINLFGSTEVAATAQTAAPTEELPTTNLRIILRGVSANTDDQQGTALIEGPDKKTERYRVSDTLPGNAKLHAVMSDRIVIARGGVYENLYFPVESDSGNIEFYRPEPDADSYQEQAYEEPQYEEPSYDPPQDNGNESQPNIEPSASIGSISEERKEEIRRKLDELRQRMKTN